MDGVSELLDDLKLHGHAQGNLLGMLNVVIGRRIEKADGTLVSNGVTWRELARLLKKVRWDKDAVLELGLNPANLPPRNRELYWYTAIAQANVASPPATQAGDRLAATLNAAGYVVGSAPGQAGS
jgi:hypothetical protein